MRVSCAGVGACQRGFAASTRASSCISCSEGDTQLQGSSRTSGSQCTIQSGPGSVTATSPQSTKKGAAEVAGLLQPRRRERLGNVVLDEEPRVELARLREAPRQTLGVGAVGDVVDDDGAPLEGVPVIGGERREVGPERGRRGTCARMC